MTCRIGSYLAAIVLVAQRSRPSCRALRRTSYPTWSSPVRISMAGRRSARATGAPRTGKLSARAFRRLADRRPFVSGRRGIRLIPMCGGMPDRCVAARRADCRRRTEGRLRVVERRRSRGVSHDARRQGCRNIERAPARTRRRAVARGAAAAEACSERRGPRACGRSSRPFLRCPAGSRRPSRVRSPACARASGTRSSSCSTPTFFARFSMTRAASATPLPSPSTVLTVHLRCMPAAPAKCASKTSSYKDLQPRVAQPEKVSTRFRMQTLNEFYYSWGPAVADFNHDGTPDIVAGPYYYLGPDYNDGPRNLHRRDDRSGYAVLQRPAVRLRLHGRRLA